MVLSTNKNLHNERKSDLTPEVTVGRDENGKGYLIRHDKKAEVKSDEPKIEVKKKKRSRK